jgi:predicted ATPase
VLELDDAVELFSHRARAVVSDLSLDPHLVQRICERLDFLPLAIELAAARTKALPPAEIHSRLDACLPLLTGGPRDAPRRQRTLRATIDWSYELLDRDEQRLFARLGVFAGGFTLPAAEAVCAARLDAVQSLVDRSLLGRDGARYRMLQTLREYAIERLEETGEADDVRRLHHKWFAALLDAEAFDMRSPGRPDDIARSAFTQERENIKSALAWALEHRQWRGWKRH